MICRWTELGLALSLLGTTTLGASCCALAQEQGFGTAPENDANGTRTAKPNGKKSDAPLEPAANWAGRENSVGPQLLTNIAEDQKALWIGPKSLRFTDADWLAPLGGAAAAMFATDTEYAKHLSNSPNRIKYSKDLSNYGLASMVGVGGGLYLLGHMTHDDHKIETGILAGEAAIDSLVPVYAMKYAFGRERPLQDDFKGRFGQGGVSFPSEHAAAAWSIASVIAHEYPGPLTSIFAYGLASAVSASRVSARQHFPSDILVGSAIGWLEGMYVYRKHHDPTIGAASWETYAEAHDSRERTSGNLASPYVPLDSWIYPALERLIAMGYVSDVIVGMRPWTRRECMRQLAEAEDKLDNIGSENSEAKQLVEALQRELQPESEVMGNAGDNGAFRLESLYSRTEYISGKPLTDGYNFAQTQFDDFGRPFSQGWNTVNGFSAYATQGRWVAYVRGEEQSAPAIPALPLAARQAVQTIADSKQDGPQLPLQPGTPEPSVTRFQLMDTYIGTTLSNFEFSFGRQSLWWGTGEGGSLDLSNNIQPIDMFRINRVTPLKLPGILGLLGSVRGEFFVGQLAGHEFIFSPLGLQGQWGQPLSDQPLIHGQNLSFKPTRNFEFGFYRTTIFGGEGYPVTWHTFGRSLLSTSNTAAGDPRKPGKRTSALDFSYRLPYLRNWVSFYGDGMTYDEFSPIAYWDRASWHAGLFFSHIPMVQKLDFRVEGVYSDLPGGQLSIGPGAIYSNGTWRSGYTNNGNLIGDWIGRAGQGAQAWTNYSFNARNRLQINFRHQKVSQQLLPGGGSLTDVGVRGDYWMRSYLGISTSVQYERWLFPVIQPNPQTDVSTSVQILFAPQKLFRRSSSATSELDSNDGGQP